MPCFLMTAYLLKLQMFQSTAKASGKNLPELKLTYLFTLIVNNCYIYIYVIHIYMFAYWKSTLSGRKSRMVLVLMVARLKGCFIFKQQVLTCDKCYLIKSTVSNFCCLNQYGKPWDIYQSPLNQPRNPGAFRALKSTQRLLVLKNLYLRRLFFWGAWMDLS